MPFTFDEPTWIAHFSEVEGNVDHFYLDGKSLVTIGIGCVVSDPTVLPMARRADNVTATPREIQAEYFAVKAMEPGRASSFYGKCCALYLPESFILSMFRVRLAEFVAQVERAITPLDGYPEAARLVVMDMAFNLGTDGVLRKFPTFTNAFRAKDWLTASRECKRTERSAEHPNGISKKRNEWARTALESLIV